VIAVTGATGRIGREVVRLLAGRGLAVRALVRDPGRGREVLGGSAALVAGDLRDPAALDRLLRGAERLFLVSSNPGLETGAVEAAARAGVAHVVKSSALGFGSDPPAGHRAVEQRIEATGIAWTHLRPNAFMDTLAEYLPQILDEEGTFRLPAGEGATAWVDTRDIAAVAAAVLTEGGHEFRAYAITGPQALTMGEVADLVADASGRPVRYVDAPPAEAREQLLARGLPGGFAEFLVAHYASVRAGGFALVSGAVKEITGRPARDLRAFLDEHAVARPA